MRRLPWVPILALAFVVLAFVTAVKIGFALDPAPSLTIPAPAGGLGDQAGCPPPDAALPAPGSLPAPGNLPAGAPPPPGGVPCPPGALPAPPNAPAVPPVAQP